MKLYLVGGKPHSMDHMLYRRDHLAINLLQSGRFSAVIYIYFANGPLRQVGSIRKEKPENGIHYIVINDYRFVLANYFSFIPAFLIRLRGLAPNTGDIALFTLPRFVSFRRLFGKGMVYYDRSDNWQAQYGQANIGERLKRSFVIFRERKLFSSATAISTSSIVIKEALEKLLGPEKRVYYIPHGFSPSVNNVRYEKEPRAEREGIHMSLVASLTDKDRIKVDHDMILRILMSSDRVYLHICGPIDQSPRLETKKILMHPRVQYHGVLSSDEVVEFIRKYDIGLVPYRLNEFTQGVLPIKLLDYVNANRPVCVTDLPSVRKDPTFSNWCLFLDDPATLETRLNSFLSEATYATFLNKAQGKLTWASVTSQLCNNVFELPS